MTAKDFLSQAWQVELQVRSKQAQIEQLRALAGMARLAFDREPVSVSRNVTGMQDTIARIMEEEEELNRRIDELVSVKVEVREMIDRVEDVMMRLILEKRYLAFQSWEEIAADLGYTLRWTMTRHVAALEEVQRILDEAGV